MGKKTKIDWFDSSWNPVTGCLHGCEYCYARKIAQRFGGGYRFVADMKKDENGKYVTNADGFPIFERLGAWPYEATGGCHVLESPANENDAHEVPNWCEEWYGEKPKNYPYPWYFDPTFHRYRLDEPAHWKKPRTIFVCSMADLFGEWVPDEWIDEVFKACEKAPQHRYLFLTKNPKRLCKMATAYAVQQCNKEHPDKLSPQTELCKNILPLPRHDNWWFGSTLDNGKATRFQGGFGWNTFTSIEPLTENMNMGLGSFGTDKWTIIGAETGNRKGKITPQREWVDNIVEAASITGMKTFMKESLRELMGADFRQEFPWDIFDTSNSNEEGGKAND